MVVVTTIGILAMLAIPGIVSASERTKATAMANDIRVFVDAVEFFSAAKGDYPKAMTYTKIPEDIASYLPSTWINGKHSWQYVNTGNFAYVYVYDLNFTAEQTVRLDKIIDDGNIATGDVRTAVNNSGLVYFFR